MLAPWLPFGGHDPENSTGGLRRYRVGEGILPGGEYHLYDLLCLTCRHPLLPHFIDEELLVYRVLLHIAFEQGRLPAF